MTTPPAGRPTFAAINAAALRQNLAALRAVVGAGVAILAVVKADSYGHGATLVAPILQAAGADYFGVATVEEGVELRTAGIHKPILVLTGAASADLSAIRQHELSIAVIHRDMVREFAAAPTGAPLRVHIKVDTGMGRLGIFPDELPALLDDLQRAGTFVIEGIFSHFANADSVDREYSDYQLTAFRQAIALLTAPGKPRVWVHMANSAAAYSRTDTHFNLIRPGLALYGVSPFATATAATEQLAPVMRLVTQVWQLKVVPSEFPISYGQTFVTRRPSLIATLPIGYADGYSRKLSNCAAVLIRGQRAPVVGTVCMDLTMVDVTDVAGVRAGDEVVLWGRQNGTELSVSEVAGWQETIPYEVLTGVGKRVPRVIE